MALLSHDERQQLARKRIASVLDAQTVVTARTLENKIADAGPTPMRVNPHVLTEVKREMIAEGTLVPLVLGNGRWLHLASAHPQAAKERLAELVPVWTEFTAGPVTKRTGQALEIAIYRALLAAPGFTTFGGFHDLAAPRPASGLLSKEETSVVEGRSLGDEALDFISVVQDRPLGIEAKNVREWLYPNRPEIKDALRKALHLRVHPVIIARRIPFVTFHVLSQCGVIMHETYNQRMAQQDAEIAARAAHRKLLGYHDIRVSDEPDARLTKFIGTNLAAILPAAAQRLAEYDDLLTPFANNEMDYIEFAARVRRRRLGLNEDNDWPDEGDAGERHDPDD